MKQRFLAFIYVALGFSAACSLGESCELGGLKKGAAESGGRPDAGFCSIWDDGVCDPAQDGCDCDDCGNTAYCKSQKGAGFQGSDCGEPEQKDGICDSIADYCVCGDCMSNIFCQDPGKTNCNNNNECEPYLEGCRCDDCKDKDFCRISPSALDNCLSPMGGGGAGGGVLGEANSICEEGESCDCVDCVGLPKCVSCFDDGLCDAYEGCFCADCRVSAICTSCVDKDNGLCDAVEEGCDCADCQGEKECEEIGGAGGMGGGGAGGLGGAGGN